MAKKTVVFVSVPMKGKSDALIERSIQITKVQYLHLKGKKVEDVAFVDNYHSFYYRLNGKAKEVIDTMTRPELGYLGNAIQTMADVDEVVFGIGYEHARGCRVEEKVASEYGIPMVKIDNKEAKEILEAIREERRKQFKKLKEKGLNNAEIAKETGFSESTVRRVLKEE